MNKVKLYILPLFLVLSSLIVVVQTMKFVRSSAYRTESSARASVSPAAGPVQGQALSPEEMLTAKNIFSALAEKNSLSVSVGIATNRIVISAEKNSDTLRNYDGILSYLTGISDLPYSMEYKGFCIGRGCSKDLMLEIALMK